jgi:hypothetical protein
MTLTDQTTKQLYYDAIITAYNTGNTKEAEQLTMRLKTSDTSDLLLFLFNNFEYLKDKNIIPFIIEIVF